MKQLVFALIFLQSLFLSAQNFEESWTGYFSYVSVKAISQGNDKIYVAAENAIFTYDFSTQEFKTVSTINGLSGKQISTIHYSENHNLLIIGYENGLIEIVKDDENDVLSVVDILDKQTIPPNTKRINHFYEYNGEVYISTQYGISVYDLGALEFGDTYFIGDFGAQIDITQTTVLDDFIYATSSTDGVRSALVENENLIDYEQWSAVVSGGYKGVQTLGNEIFLARNDNQIFSYSSGNGLNFETQMNSSVVNFEVHLDLLTITTTNSIHAYSENFILESEATSLLEYDFILQAGLAYNNTFYLGTNELGVLVVPFGNNQAQQILPDGPLLNKPFAIDASPGRLWVVFGEVDVNFNPYFPNGTLSKRGISNLKEEAWTNIDYEDLIGQLGVEDVTDISYVTINPENSNEVYMSSYHKGLLKIEEQTPSILYNETNSPLSIPNNNEGIGIRLYGSDFDREENLWFVQSRANEGLIKLNPNGQFQFTDISTIIEAEDEQALTEIKVSREGYPFFGSANNGLIGYNPTTNVLNKIGEGLGTGGLPSNNVRALAFDNQNRLWIGTIKGLRVLYGVGDFFDGGETQDAQAIIILEDGVAQELLYEQSITDIEVDGSNNKWVATATSGVFYFSPNGQETLLRFTSDNSPLPSDNVQDIAIDGQSGTVYFATTDGLVAYNGSSTAPREDLESVYAFPNPVRPDFYGDVTIDGLTAKANVKITDVTGNLVYETTSEGGSVRWDTTAFGKYRVASGVYLVLVSTDDALETKVIKIMIIR